MPPPPRNPFRPTFGVSPTVMAGRSSLLSAFGLGLAEGPGSPYRALIISGARGVGKTVLLNELEDSALAQGWVHLRAYPGPEMISTLVHTSIPELLDTLGSPTSRRMLSGGSITGVGSVTTVADPGHRRPQPTLITRLREVAAILQPRGTGVLITLDELQSADPRHLHDLATAVQDLMRDNHDIAFVAAGLPAGVEDLLQQEGTTFLRRAHRVDLTSVRPEEAARLFADTAESGGRVMETAAVDEAVRQSHGYPYLMQVVGSLAWAQANLQSADSITLDHVRMVREAAIERMGIQIHGPSFQGIPDQQMHLLHAIAELSPDNEPVRTGDIAAHLDVAPNAISMAREALLRRSLVIVPRYGYLQFALPYAADHLLAHPHLRP
jgi:hypothetical protein